MTGNHLDVVKDVRRLLDARGQKWETNCDALEITGRVAWRLRDRGAVLLTKMPAQNGCTLLRGPHIGRRVSHDAIGFPDGWVDILVSAGPPANVNGPAWDWHDGPPSTGLVPWDLDAGVQPDQPGGGTSGGNGETTNLEALVAINLQLGQLLNMTSSVVQSVRALPRADQYDELVSAYKDLSQRFVKVVETLERIEKRQNLGVRGPFSVRTIHLTPPETI